ncbi:LEA type 2 family protein [Niveibacterium sp.]|uniref:LEA type 2 family protein n=1 Tax=Niveibacterium sp. TaxID=2017444 RepID=UPI0035B06887
MRALARLLILGWLLLAAGCAIMALGLQKPEVSVEDVSLLPGGGMLQQRMHLTLRVSNPNEKDIAVDGLTFGFEINGQKVATGMTGQSVVLPRLGETTVGVDVSASLIELLAKLPKVLEGGKAFGYRVHGEVLTRDYGRLPFDRKGELSIDKLAEKAGGAPPTGQRGQF